jgi:serine/threonine protein kinase
MEVTQSVFRKRFTYDPVKDLLGKGGFGEVYKAYDNEDHLFVALKIAQGTTNDKYNLINEIKRFKKLNHPNIVKHIEAYEVNTGGTDIHGNPIIHHVGILEYADRGTFADLLKKGTNYRQIEDIAKDITDGLAYLHSEGIIHRDLKPTNILLFSEGEKLRAKITDFGIAKRADATAASTQLVGTVEYMAPEYFTTGNITPASDVWSVGVMLLEALTGSHPFGKTSQDISNEQIIANILNKDITTATQNITEPLKGIITRCLFREANMRPQSATGFKGLLLSSGDSFSERTQVVNLKNPSAKTERTEPKWKRWVKALFDFDVMGGKWRKVLAREFILILFLSIAFYWLTPSNGWYIHFRKNKLEKSKSEITLKFNELLKRYPQIKCEGKDCGDNFINNLFSEYLNEFPGCERYEGDAFRGDYAVAYDENYHFEEKWSEDATNSKREYMEAILPLIHKYCADKNTLLEEIKHTYRSNSYELLVFLTLMVTLRLAIFFVFISIRTLLR